MIRKDDIIKLKSFVDDAKNIVIIPHHNPDGDAIGASLALYGVLKQKKKNVTVISPNDFPEFLEWMEGAAEVVNFEKEKENVVDILNNTELVFFLDFNGLSRLKSLEEAVKGFQGRRIMIDHHPGPDNIADVMISAPEASATCELMYDTISLAGWKEYLNKDLAECIYAGIMTDTGSLSYNSSRPEIYHIVADLVEIGVDKEKVHKLVFHSNSFNRMKLLGHALGSKMFLLEDAPAAYIELSAEELDRFDFKPGDTEGFVNYPLWIEGVFISALFMEHPDKIKVSLRSSGTFPVNKFSEKFYNGGGHLNAAGGEFYGTLKEVVKIFRTKLPEYIKNKLWMLLVVLFTLVSCSGSDAGKRRPVISKMTLMNINKKLVDYDAQKIQKYVDSLGLDMNTAKTGLWYLIKEEGTGPKVKKGQVITLSYKVSLLDGTVCYDSKDDGIKQFEVGHGGVESGLEEGVLLLNKGAKAVFILPPYLAHGLLGDENKIPAHSTIVYDVEVLSID